MRKISLLAKTFLFSSLAFGQTIQTVQTQPAYGSACPSAPNIQYNDLTGHLYVCMRPLGWNPLLATTDYLFSQTNSVTVVNSTAETSILGTGDGTATIPANFFAVGRIIRVRVYGYHSATANPNITIKVKINGTTILNTGAYPSHTATTEGFTIEAFLTCRTTGTSGTFIGQGFYQESGSTPVSVVMTTAQTVDTTKALPIDVTVQWDTASASDSITSTNAVIY